MGADDDNQMGKWPVHTIRSVMDTLVLSPVQTMRDIFGAQQKKNPSNWYHRKFRRVPTIDQCDVNDRVCRFEANEQYQRDKKVDTQIVKILRMRLTDCMYYWGNDKVTRCKGVQEDYDTAAANFLLQHGEIAVSKDVVEVYMKQKHRLIWERRQNQLKQ